MDPLHPHDERVLILAPTRRDGEMTQALLTEAGVPSAVCPSVDDLVASLADGAAAILMAEELVSEAARARLASALTRQAPWSDLPILVLTRPGADSAIAGEAVRTLGNVTLLERPIRVTALVSAVRTAVRARERQYQIRGYLVDRIRAEEALRAADRKKDEFLATLGHELRNPLAPILTGLHVLKLAPMTEPMTTRACAVMEQQVNHLVRLVDDLLEVSRITRGVIDVHKEPLELGQILRAAVEISRPAIDAAQHTLTVDIGTAPLPVAGDSVRLTQVFSNLLNNASKYTNTGGHIWLSAARVKEWVIVSVRDDGIGIPRSELTTVFDMFAQVDRSHRRTQGGLGIGLTLVRSLVTMHGGIVDARSDGPNLGSEFVVRLPVMAELRAPAEASTRLPAFPARRLLIVDDNLDAAETLATLLGALGATVSVAHNGPDALRMLEAFDPEAILLDIGMPGMDGYEVAAAIRASPDHAGVLLIALTGWGQDDDREKSRRVGFDHHLVKPPDIGKLRTLLETPVRLRASHLSKSQDAASA